MSDNDNDDFDFASAMQGITPHSHDKADLTPTPKKLSAANDATAQYKRRMASQDTESLVDGLSSEIVQLVESEEELIFATPGIQLKMMKRLKQGHIPWEAGLDLHGFSLDEARDELSRFIRDASQNQCRCVIVIHGKAYSGEGQQPLVKSYVNDWLKQMHQVTAFCSAQPKDGGTGALYVLLRNANKR
ncbi:Smr/MutS family protein [Aliamphritea hakodatensis]|uniref:Smr/MutS family protein n=1 Tax=Aliamphritea hakodatensis TaxID=2895352 RepID=UPI0022FD4533|nr:Smr/MutS family protein [Aliamphritea hakodatensis]